MDIAKVVQVISTSQTSFEDAVQRGVTQAAKTVRGITGVKVLDWTAKVQNDTIVSYKVTLDIAFGVEDR